MDSACRICKSSSVSSVDIFAKSQLAEIKPSVVEILFVCANLKIRQTDKLSKKLCDSCILDAESAYRLKCNSAQTYKKLIKLKLEQNKDFIDTLEAEDWTIIRVDVKEEAPEEDNIPQSQSQSVTAKRTNPQRLCRRDSNNKTILEEQDENSDLDFSGDSEQESFDLESSEESVQDQPQNKRKTVQKRVTKSQNKRKTVQKRQIKSPGKRKTVQTRQAKSINLVRI